MAAMGWSEPAADLCHLCQFSHPSISYRCCPRCSLALQELSPVHTVLCGQEGFEPRLIFFQAKPSHLYLTFLQGWPKVALPTPGTTVQHSFREGWAASTTWPRAGLKAVGIRGSAFLCSATGCRLWSRRFNPALQQRCKIFCLLTLKYITLKIVFGSKCLKNSELANASLFCGQASGLWNFWGFVGVWGHKKLSQP